MRYRISNALNTRKREYLKPVKMASSGSDPGNGARLKAVQKASLQEDVASSSNEVERTFVLKNDIQFGFHSVCSQHVRISDNLQSAEKKEPSAYYAYGVAYGARPLRGTSEFEVEITSYGTGWSGTLKLGVMRCREGSEIQAKDIPRYTPEGPDHCVWSSDKVHNRLSRVPQEKAYGLVNLDELREGDRVGLRLTRNGELGFFVNGKWQGVAATRVHQRGFDVYPVIDHYANCRATRITRAGVLDSRSYKHLNYLLSTSCSCVDYFMYISLDLVYNCLSVVFNNGVCHMTLLSPLQFNCWSSTSKTYVSRY